MAVLHWLLHAIEWTWNTNPNGGYNPFSGPIPDVTLLGGIWLFYRKHNCHVQRCWRIAKHPIDGTPYVTCKKHHPHVPDKVTTEHIGRLV